MEGTGTAVPATARHETAAPAVQADVMNTESPAEAVTVTNMTNPAVPAAVMATEGIPMEEAAVPKEKSPCPKRGRPEREEGSLCLQWKWSLLLCWQLFSGRC